MNYSAFSQPDITLMLDMEGVIKHASISSAIPAEGIERWVGRPWSETVGGAGGNWIRRMLADARSNGVSAFREIRQRFPSGLELPIEYTTVRLGGGAGLIAIGKSLQAVAELQSRLIAAQHAREQDYWKLREIETRSRLLFDASSEATLVVEADTLRVIEANPAAIRAFGVAPGWEFLREVAPRDVEAFRDMLRRAREQGRAPGIAVHLGAELAAWLVRATLMTREPGPVFLLQLTRADADPQATARGAMLRLDDLLERLPDGFVVINHDGIVMRANRAFVALAQMPTEGAVLGQSLGRWLSGAGDGLAALLAKVDQHGEVRRLPSVLRGELGQEVEVELSAVASGVEAPRVVGIVMREAGCHTWARAESSALREAIGAIEAGIGQTPLPMLVRRTVDAIERHCIERALGLAEGNRTAAAELLGLSRQSLYAKLGRYGLQADAEKGDGDQG